MAAAAATAALLTAGCSTVPGITGASSMRVEVDAYKGPLLKEWETQWSELFGLIDEAESIVAFLTDEAVISARRLGCEIRDERAPAAATPDISVRVTVPEQNRWRRKDRPHQTCHILASLLSDLGQLVADREAIRKDETFQDYRADTKLLCFVPPCGDVQADMRAAILGKTSEFAFRFKQKALDWAQYHAATQPHEMRMRITIANTAAFLSEYGNKLGSRADSLMKQESGPAGGLSVMLRDAATTDFLNLYDWNNAMTRRTGEKREDRVRLVERLVSDANWVKVNTVFASGQGDFRVALIKDDIGNWNLKSFDNDPTEVLEAYKKVGLAALKGAAKLAAKAYGGDAVDAGGKAIHMALQVADQTALAAGPPPTAVEPAMLHKNVVRSLTDLGARCQTRWDALTAELAAATTLQQTEEAKLAGVDASLDTLGNERAALDLALQAKLRELSQATNPSGEDPPSAAVDPALLGDIERLRADLKLKDAELAAKRNERTLAHAASLKADRALEELQNERARFPHQTRAEAAAILHLHAGVLDDLERSMIQPE